MGHVLSPGAARLADAGLPADTGAIARIDPRVRIAAAAAFAVVTVALTQFAALGAAFAAALGLLALSRLPARETLKRMALMDGFILFMLVLLPFTVPGTPIVTVFGFGASWEGLYQAIEIALTANAVILALMSLVGSMEPVTLGHALHAMRCPPTLVHLLMFTVRYVDVLHEEYSRLKLAMKVRGFRPGTNWHTYRSMGYLVGMMLVRAVERSERILGAMKCRGFSGRIVLLEQFVLRAADGVFVALFAATLMALVVLEVAVGAA